MARFFALIIMLYLIVGCGSHNEMVQELPPPNFSGPALDPLMAVRPMPAQPTMPAPRLPVRPGLGDPAWAISTPPRPWKWIVIHHSATSFGGAARFDRDHRAKGWDELGYHFVIGNGTDTGNGQIEVGSRWPKQKYGAHAKTPDEQFNNFGIGICLVGNFDIENPTQKQMQSVVRLVAYLQATYHIPSDHIVGHGMVHNIAGGGTVTDCPGKNMNIALIRRMAQQTMADAGVSFDGARTASAEMEPQVKSDQP